MSGTSVTTSTPRNLSEPSFMNSPVLNLVREESAVLPPAIKEYPTPSPVPLEDTSPLSNSLPIRTVTTSLPEAERASEKLNLTVADGPSDNPVQTSRTPRPWTAIAIYLGTALVSGVIAAFQFRKLQKERAEIPALLDNAESIGAINAEEKNTLLNLHHKTPGIFRGLLNDMQVMGYLADKGMEVGRCAVRRLAIGIGLSATAVTALGAAGYSLLTGDVVSTTIGLSSLFTTAVLTPLGLNKFLRNIGHDAVKESSTNS